MESAFPSLELKHRTPLTAGNAKQAVYIKDSQLVGHSLLLKGWHRNLRRLTKFFAKYVSVKKLLYSIFMLSVDKCKLTIAFNTYLYGIKT